MKIVYYTDQIYLHGGIERVLANKVNYFINEKGFEVFIVTSEQKGNSPCYHIDDKVKLHDIGINYNRNLSYFHPINFIKVFKHFFLLKKKLKELNPDVVIVCNFAFDFFFIPFIYPKIIKIKEFHSSRDFEYHFRKQNKSFIKDLYYKINDYIESKYHYLALLTNDEKRYYKSKNTVVVPNSLTNYPDNYAALTNKKVISAGRIAPVKGFEKLIQAWVLIAKENPDWSLNIYGDGEPEYIYCLKMLIDSLELQNKVKICGSTNNIEQIMLNASIYAMTSITECFPMVLLEALSCGLPVVSFDCPNGPRNIIINNSDGILVENENIDKFALTIMKLINDESFRKRMGKQARENIKRFESSIVMEYWINLFTKSTKNLIEIPKTEL